MAESSFLWLEPELRRIEALIVKDLSPGDSRAAEVAMRRAVECARSLGFPVLEYRCLQSLKDLLGPEHGDPELNSRLAGLSHLGELSDRAARFAQVPEPS